MPPPPAPPRATARHTTADGFPAVELRAGPLEARFVPSAGMVGVSLRHEGEELLAREEGLAAYVELARDLPHDEHGLPIHGVLPQSWRVLVATTAGEQAVLHAALEFSSPA